MTKAHSTLKNDKTKTPIQASKQRHYTIGYTPNLRKPTPYPQLLIKGRWLEQLGFTTGQAVTITTKQGQLIIKLARQIAEIKKDPD